MNIIIYIIIPGVPKNVPHLNLEYPKNYARDMILVSSESALHGNWYALTNTFPVMKQLGNTKKGDSQILLQIRICHYNQKVVSQPKSGERPRERLWCA